jgi:hypothetical protein
LVAYGLNRVLPAELIPSEYLIIGVVTGALLMAGKYLRDLGVSVTPFCLAFLLFWTTGCAFQLGEHRKLEFLGSMCIGVGDSPIGTIAFGSGELACDDVLGTSRPAVVVEKEPAGELVNDGS